MSLGDMVTNIIAGNESAAQEDFLSIISAKLSDALDAKKQEMAQAIYRTQDEQEEVDDGQEDN